MEPLAKIGFEHEVFALEYVKTSNATRAYRVAYPDAELSTAGSRSSELLKDPLVSALVERYRDVLREEYAIDAHKVIGEMKKMAFSEITDVVEISPTSIVATDDNDGERVIIQEARLKPVEEISPDARAAISEISTGPNGAMKVKMHSKREALKDLGVHLGLFEQRVNVDVKVTHDLSAVAREALERVRAIRTAAEVVKE